MKELWTLTLMSDRGLKSEDSVMSSLSSGSCRQMGPLYVRLTVRSGCMAGFRSRELPSERKLICHSDTKRHLHYPSTIVSADHRATYVMASCWDSSQHTNPTLPPGASGPGLGIRRILPIQFSKCHGPKSPLSEVFRFRLFKVSIAGSQSGN